MTDTYDAWKLSSPDDEPEGCECCGETGGCDCHLEREDAMDDEEWL